MAVGAGVFVTTEATCVDAAPGILAGGGFAATLPAGAAMECTFTIVGTFFVVDLVDDAILVIEAVSEDMAFIG